MAENTVAGHLYNKPESTPSTIGPQMNTYQWDRKSLIDAEKDIVFSRLANVRNMPKNFGKTIKAYHYMPLLSDLNVNDQGIDAKGAQYAKGNIYGSSRDVGTISSKLPTLSETGGRVNRVGFTRKVIEGSMHKMGFFYEFSRESMDFDSDAELHQHMRREAIQGAAQMYEAQLQIDLLNGAGVVMYAGAATKDSEVTGEGATPSLVSFDDLMKLYLVLKDNRTPQQTQYIYGSRMIDTRTISKGYVMYASSDMLPHFMSMQNYTKKDAWIPVEQYGDAGTIMEHEVGTVGMFRIVTPPEMLKWEGAGAAVTGAASTPMHSTNSKYDIYPLLVVGAESFSTIGFFYSGEKSKFSIISKLPGMETADRTDPYGEMGFCSIKWWYGFLPERTERLAVIKTVAPM